MKTKIKNIISILLLMLIVSCSNDDKTESNKPKILGDGHSFELDKINFNEDVIALYSKVSTIDSLKEIFKKYDAFPNYALLDDKDVFFKIFEVKSLDISIPKNPVGFEFKSKTSDSLAKFHGLYFDEVKSLTNLDRKLIAINAYSRYRNENQRDSLLKTISQIYGNPFMKIRKSTDFDTKSYSWITKDRLIEVKTSFGHSLVVSTSGKSENYQYYRLDLLIIDNNQLKSLVRDHMHYFDDNFKDTYEPRLAGSDFLPDIINIKEYFLDNGQYHIE